MPSSQGQRLQQRTRTPTLRLKLDPVAVSLKPIKVIDLDDERKKEDMEKSRSREKNKSIKGSEKVTRKGNVFISEFSSFVLQLGTQVLSVYVFDF